MTTYSLQRKLEARLVRELYYQIDWHCFNRLDGHPCWWVMAERYDEDSWSCCSEECARKLLAQYVSEDRKEITSEDDIWEDCDAKWMTNVLKKYNSWISQEMLDSGVIMYPAIIDDLFRNHV
jgi:hypothetical protein